MRQGRSPVQTGNGKGNEGDFVSFNKALSGAISVAAQAFQNEGHVTGLTSGLRDLDKNRWAASIGLADSGRASCYGKTALATKMAFSAARAIMDDAEETGEKPKGAVAIFSLEMSAEQLATRILSEQAEVSGERIRRGDIGQKEFDRFVRVSHELARLPLVIDDTPAISFPPCARAAVG